MWNLLKVIVQAENLCFDDSGQFPLKDAPDLTAFQVKLFLYNVSCPFCLQTESSKTELLLKEGKPIELFGPLTSNVCKVLFSKMG